MKPTDTPQNTCPHCGAKQYSVPNQNEETTYWRCGTRFSRCLKVYFRQSGSCYERQLTASKAEVERLKGRMKEAEDLIQRGQAGWEKEREFHRKTSENAGREISNLKAIENNLLLDVHTLHTKNICLQELIQEFYEWSRRDYPTEQEVREIMNRYHDLLNK